VTLYIVACRSNGTDSSGFGDKDKTTECVCKIIYCLVKRPQQKEIRISILSGAGTLFPIVAIGPNTVRKSTVNRPTLAVH
jgi:hypothetical protein